MFSHPTHPQLVDATPFRKFSREVIKDEMGKYGMDLGDEFFTDGITGKPLRVFAFFGPCYYQRLRHQVIDKVHARAKGPRQTLSRQPAEGRNKGGGLRTGGHSSLCLSVC
jgi:DNA-directed RNA polymerase III subunit RPC2